MIAFMQAGVAGEVHPLGAAGPLAHRLSTLWWIGFVAVAAVFLLAMALLAAGLLRRRAGAGSGDETPADLQSPPPMDERRWLVLGGIVMPVAVLALLFVATLVTLGATGAPAAAGALAVQVIGHQWWWEIRYPGRNVVTANEIHIPAGQPVQVELLSRDVIHSFWVPSLGGKTDAIPGQRNVAWIQADHPGRFLGECAEFCGVQHAHMRMVVIAEDSASFARWVANEASSVSLASETPALVQGRVAFHDRSCAYCHTIRGTGSHGYYGPDLTHLASRASIGAGTWPNDDAHRAAWIQAPQSAKPGVLMPAVPMSGDEFQALLRYLAALH